MRFWIRKLMAGAAFGLGVLLVAVGVPAVFAAAIPSFGPPGGANPITFNEFADMATLINNINSSIGNWLTLNNSASEAGEIAVTGTYSTTANGTVATALSSLGPTGSHTTVQEWVVFVDSTGKVIYVPGF